MKIKILIFYFVVCVSYYTNANDDIEINTNLHKNYQKSFSVKINNNKVSNPATVFITKLLEKDSKELTKLLDRCKKESSFRKRNLDTCKLLLGTNFDKFADEIKKEKPKKIEVTKKKPKTKKSVIKKKKVTKVESRPILSFPPKPKKTKEYIAKVGYFNELSSNVINQVNNSSQEDYTDIGLEKNEASYPVDLARTITTDKIIDATLIDEVNSELGGKVTALINSNVYGKHGRKILIPAGSVILGDYGNIKAKGVNRLAISWNRIITPAGITILIDGVSSDSGGSPGLTGKVYNRYFERFGVPLLSTTLNALITNEAFKYQEQSTDTTIRNEAVNSYAQNLSNITQQIINDTINIKPVIVIPKGTLFYVNFANDVWFREPKNRKIEVLAQEIN